MEIVTATRMGKESEAEMNWKVLKVDDMLSSQLWEMFWFLRGKIISIELAQEHNYSLVPMDITESWQGWLNGGGKIGDALLLEAAMNDVPEDFNEDSDSVDF